MAGIEDLENTTYVEELIESDVSYYLHMYGYVVIGPMLILINTPVFLIVMTRKALRISYLVLAAIFFNSALTGVSAILVGTKRLLISAVEQYTAHYNCVLDVSISLLTMFFLNGWSLLMNSAERFCVVAYPIYYYTHSKQITYLLIVAEYIITIVAITLTALASFIEPIRFVSNYCLLQQVYNSYFYVGIALLSSSASLLKNLVLNSFYIIHMTVAWLIFSGIKSDILKQH
uniref:G_PROTEIN_RECEP_F1_2 domain-containing protein n=1 Tax=Elaeophora elaphi TaxID=1147741 RepID=A0A0R3RNU5_9BILA